MWYQYNMTQLSYYTKKTDNMSVGYIIYQRYHMLKKYIKIIKIYFLK